MVTDGDLGHPGPDLDHLAGPLVAGHEGGGLGDEPVHGRQVGVADAGGVDLDPHLSGRRVGDLDVHDVELAVTCPA